MPAKKTTAKTASAKPAKKRPIKRVEAAKPAEAVTEKKETVKKETVKKEPVKKAAEKKTLKKETVKKAPAKKAEKKEVKKEDLRPKKSFQEYKDVINWKKWEAHNMNWLYIEVNAGDLMTELEAGVNNLETCCKAILDCMLEGDHFIVEPKEADKVSTTLTVRYYCDNLSEDRRKWSDVNH